MAISATINKLILNIADMDRQYYQSHELTIAQHPSETDLRFMMRIIAFALNAHELLTFTKGLCADDEPELWQKSLTEEIDVWIDLGQVDEKRIRKACGRARQVIVYTYDEHKAMVWWEQQVDKLQRYKNLKVVHIDANGADVMVQRNMDLQCNIQDGEMYLSSPEKEFIISWQNKKV
jgi:uncharacterized protein YaeQ